MTILAAAAVAVFSVYPSLPAPTSAPRRMDGNGLRKQLFVGFLFPGKPW